MNFHDRPRSVWAFPLIALAVVLLVFGSDWLGLGTGLRGLLFGAYRLWQPVPTVTAASGSRAAELAVLALAGLAVVLTAVRFGARWSLAATIAAIGAIGALSWHLYSVRGYFLDALGPGVGIAIAFAGAAIARLLEIAEMRGRLRAAFGGMLAPKLIERLARRPSLLKLGGESRTITYLTCRLHGLSGAAPQTDAGAFADLRTRYLAPLLDAAFANEATIAQIGGDGFACFWNAPLQDSDHARLACATALAMSNAINSVNPPCAQEEQREGCKVEAHTGIDTGQAIVSGFPMQGRMIYSAASDCASASQAMQAYATRYGYDVIAGQNTRDLAERSFAFLEIDTVMDEEGDKPVKLYALIGDQSVRCSPKFRAVTTFHDNIFQALRAQQWNRARELIEQCRNLSGARQKLYELHLARIAWFEQHPPGPEWDGAFRPILK